MNKELLEKNMERHSYGLSKYACQDKDAIRLKEDNEDIRSPFFRDIDRIIYTYAFLRTSDKTQVFSVNTNDHISKRMIHVQYVSKIGRTIGRALGLNEDLIEAASLGHDLGHVPFGHFGESILNTISLEHQEGYFNHNVESVRLLMDLEHKGEGVNVTVQVLDAILCHNGEIVEGIYSPVKKTITDFLQDYHNTYVDKDGNNKLHPMTLEGCVVRISDVIAYLGKDIEDARILGMIKKEDIPMSISETLGIRNKDIINTIVLDIIHNSLDKPFIKMSDKIYQAVEELKKFNYQHIYMYSLSKEKQEKIKIMFYTLYDTFYEDVLKNNKDSIIYKDSLNYKIPAYFEKTTKERQVIDFIAGMTDDYFIKCYDNIKKNYNKE